MDSETINTSVNGEMDYSDLRAKLLQNKDKPAIINVTIGTMFKGAIDDVDVILETLKECGYSQDRFYIHCDAALCGLMTPFVNNMISFNNPIGSVTISSHKLLGCPMPCGVQITRKSPNSRETISSCTMRRYLPGDGGVVLLLRRCNWRRLASWRRQASWWRETWRRSEKVDRERGSTEIARVDRDSNARGLTEREKERGGQRRERERRSTIDDEKERGGRRSTTREREARRRRGQ
ncbi:uncharacterized protein [Solanum lycopersicum]|uniref:uncharacterized protein n=1 Tax=Solanum lycopersicum TaxID=4081 RepID=UPI0037482839